MTKRWIFAAIALFAAGAEFAQAAEPDDAARPLQARGMARVEGGTFNMGGRGVTVGSFYMDVHLVTQREWRELMGTTVQQQRDRANPSWAKWRGTVETAAAGSGLCAPPSLTARAGLGWLRRAYPSGFPYMAGQA